jgi:hypothetical protein
LPIVLSICFVYNNLCDLGNNLITERYKSSVTGLVLVEVIILASLPYGLPVVTATPFGGVAYYYY